MCLSAKPSPATIIIIAPFYWCRETSVSEGNSNINYQDNNIRWCFMGLTSLISFFRSYFWIKFESHFLWTKSSWNRTKLSESDVELFWALTHQQKIAWVDDVTTKNTTWNTTWRVTHHATSDTTWHVFPYWSLTCWLKCFW